ncbi:MAG: DEAD/DEAH box helicase, partial [Candidatus Gastranaerophilales bacterium]|nr:DEAD/DEAH box helicase [Candidatus Gastranaerophilales bacterium]
NNIVSYWKLFCSTGENSENIFYNLDNLRKDIYKNGTDRELLFIDILCAVVKMKHLHTTWYTIPLFTDIDKETWKPILTKIGIKELWPSQILIGKNEIFKGKSATIQMPTSAGKTKATELIIRSTFLAGRTNLALIVAPFRALCHDIQDDLQKAFSGENIEIDELSDAYQVDYELENSWEQKKILVLTPEKLLYILRQTPELSQNIGLIIYDEGHQFDSPSRGTNYELLLASLKSMLPEHCQTILISAVIGNITDVDNWLNGDNSVIINGKNIASTYRTIAFTSWIETKGKIQFVNQANPELEEYYVPRIIEQEQLNKIGKERNNRFFPQKNNSNSISIYLGEKLVNQGSVAIFCGQKRSIKKLCDQVNDLLERQYNFYNIIKCSNSNEINKIYNLYKANLGETSYTKAAKIGILTHHRTIPQGIRLSVENAMKESLAKFVICTSTLAQGVNMPIRYLIINSTQQGSDSITVRDFQNLIGRAGRAGMYTEGSIIFANNELYDSRRNPQEQWKWKKIKKLIDPHNIQICDSRLFELFRPINNGNTYKGLYKTMAPLDFVIAYINNDVENLITEISNGNSYVSMHYGKNQLFKEEDIRKQCNDKIYIIKDIESFILAQVDFQDDYEEKIKELAESTLAYYLGNSQQKEQITELFMLLAKHILESTQDTIQRRYFAKTLYGIKENIELQNWIKKNCQKLINTIDINLFLELIFEKLMKYTNSKFYNQCSQPNEVKDIINLWINGKSYYKILEYLINKGVHRETQERTYEYQVDDIVEFCENTIAYDGSLFIGAVIELLPSINCGYDITNIIENLKLIQKRFKYGLSSNIEIILSELGFNDRTIVQELSIYLQNIPERFIKKHIIKKYLSENKEMLRPIFMTFPSYFAEKMENI